MGRTLMGLSVLMVGFGNIGRELAVRLKPFGVSLAAVRRQEWPSEPLPDREIATSAQLTGSPEHAETYLDHRGGPEDTLRLAAEADVVVLVCNLTQETRGMVRWPIKLCTLEAPSCFNVTL